MQIDQLNLDNLHIRTYPDQILRQPAEPVEVIDSNISALVEIMTEHMIAEAGVGLAATQMGVSLQVAVISLTGKAQDAMVFINPELSDFQGWQEMEEGCLSLPGIRAMVRRHEACKVSALDLEGNRFVMDAVDLAAIALQHETDHLKGTLFIDRLSAVSRLACRKGLKYLESIFPSTE